MENKIEPWNILVIDDDATILNTIKVFLKNLSFQDRPVKITCVNNSKEAKKILSSKKIHIALIDLSIEQKYSGLDLVKYIRSNLNNFITRLIIIASVVDSNKKTSPEFITREFDVNGFILKPNIVQEILVMSIITSLRAYDKLEYLKKQMYAQEETTKKISLQSDKILQTKSILDAIINRAMQMPLIIVSDDLEISHYNEAASLFFGIPQENILGRSVREIHQSLGISPKKVGEAMDILEGGGEFTFGITRSVNGRKLTCNIRFFSIYIEDQSSVFVLAGDKKITPLVDNSAPFSEPGKLKGDTQVSPIPNIITGDPKMIKICNMIKDLSYSSASIMITGETGTGKELIAEAIKTYSVRKDKPYLAINCGALHGDLLEAELFGYVKGAFTGADKDTAGFFEKCDGGTLFLDEIGDASPSVQVKLLRVLQNGTFLPIGARKEKKVDVRILAATHQDLREMIRERKFREDLYYRLNVVPINLPALKYRQVDIGPLVQHFLSVYSAGDKIVSTQCLNALCDYNWPGNIRELQNAIEYVSAICKEKVIQITHLPQSLQDEIKKFGYITRKIESTRTPEANDINRNLELKTINIKKQSLSDFSDEEIIKNLLECDGHKGLTAGRFGVHRSTLYRRLQKIRNSKK